MRVVVVGAGVVGLTCAVRLAEEGYEAHVLARDLPLETTSAVAAAVWYPYRAEPHDRVLDWSARTFDALARLAESQPRSGVRMLPGTELLRSRPFAPPWWAPAVPAGYEEPAPDVLPSGYPAARRLSVPVVDMSVHLPWLLERLDAAGGTLTRASLSSLPEAPLVVNASGLAGRRLAGDDSLVPVRGQVVHVEAPGVREWLLDCDDESEMTYVVPRERVVVVGGVAEVGSWVRDPDPQTAAAILARATRLVPELAGARVVGHRVGLRPSRPAVRLEAERRGASTVVHCYGHGGAGVTLAQGCAEDVVALVREAVPASV